MFLCFICVFFSCTCSLYSTHVWRVIMKIYLLKEVTFSSVILEWTFPFYRRLPLSVRTQTRTAFPMLLFPYFPVMIQFNIDYAIYTSLAYTLRCAFTVAFISLCVFIFCLTKNRLSLSHAQSQTGWPGLWLGLTSLTLIDDENRICCCRNWSGWICRSLATEPSTSVRHCSLSCASLSTLRWGPVCTYDTIRYEK